MMDRLYVDWDALKGVTMMDIRQAEALVLDAYAKADLAWRRDGDVYAAGVADGMVFAKAVLELARRGVELG